MAIPPPPQWDTQLARALYAYLSSGENQLSFLEGDLISLIGERNKGWQFGENLRTQASGWFPLAYTEILDDFVGYVITPLEFIVDMKPFPDKLLINHNSLLQSFASKGRSEHFNKRPTKSEQFW